MLQVKVTHAGPWAFEAFEACVYSSRAVLETMGFMLATCMLTRVFKRKPIDVYHCKYFLQEPNDNEIKNTTDSPLMFCQSDLQVCTPVERDRQTFKANQLYK